MIAWTCDIYFYHICYYLYLHLVMCVHDYLDVVLAQEVGVVLGQTLLHPVGQRGAPGPHQRHAQVACRGCRYI